ncbi:MAG TPA: hypothetical protein VF278_00465 [Pirellulales bacterium]
MQLLCPECLGPLATTDGRTARCTLHGGTYRILFWRQAPRTPPQPMPGTMPVVNRLPLDASPYASPAAEVRGCPRHPSVDAPFTCAGCMTPMCQTCSFLRPDGRRFCPDCMSPAPLKLPANSGELNGVKCSRHPEVPAVVRCQACSAPVCATCDFLLPGQIHACPGCVSRTDHRLSSKRKTMLGWAFALAIFATLGMAALFSGAMAGLAQGPGGQEVIGMLFSLVSFFPSLIGTALAFSTLDRRLSNPGVIWVAIVWNCLLLAVFVLLTVIGTFMG